MASEQKLSVEDVRAIAQSISRRRAVFAEEPVEQTIAVVLVSAGDRFTAVSCVAGEWSGVKGDLTPTGGIPTCPNGHVLIESSSGRKALGWVPDDLDFAVPHHHSHGSTRAPIDLDWLAGQLEAISQGFVPESGVVAACRLVVQRARLRGEQISW